MAMRPVGKEVSGWRDPRAYCALLLLIFGLYLGDFFDTFFGHLLAHALHIHHSVPGTLGQGSYGAQMLARLLWDFLLWMGVCLFLQRCYKAFPFRDRRCLLLLCIGLATGLFVMLATMLSIWGLGAASVSLSGQTLTASLQNGATWLVLDFIGALGEEIVGRAVILVTVERFLGSTGAIIVSGVMFSGFHLGNPGASRVWLLRLLVQGCLLAYAVFRTQSLWWSVGYHTGWNWVSAPLFGAAGSGYLDEGHIFNFESHGSILVTGGSVGPEGSLIAFFAVLLALFLLMKSTQPPPVKSSQKG